MRPFGQLAALNATCNRGRAMTETHPDTLADMRDALAGIAAVAALLSGADPAEVDRTAIARLIQLKAECMALKLERLAEQESAS
jgi:hypothetical protein